MRVFYEEKIQEVCRAFRFPHKIQVYCFGFRHAVIKIFIFLIEVVSFYAGNSHYIF